MIEEAAPTRRGAAWWLAAIVGVGLALRLAGAAFGLPAVYNPDEVAIMTRAMAFATGDLNPHNFVYPTLFFYVLFAWQGLAFLAGVATGVFSSLADFERSFFVDPTFIYLAGRGLSATFGALTLVVTYRLGARVFGRTEGLMAALFLAVAPIAVRDAHYVKHDVPVTLLIVLTHLVLAGLLLSPPARRGLGRWILAGAIAGLAMSMHYYAILLVVPLIAVAWLTPPEATVTSRARVIGAIGVGAAICFFAGSPFILVEPAIALRDAVANRQIVMDRAVAPAGLFGSLGTYLRLLVTDGLTWPVAVAAGAGLVLILARDWRRAMLVAAFPVAFLLFVANTVPATRYLNPVLPLLALAAAVPVGRLARALSPSGWLAAGLAGLLAVPALAASLRADRFFQQTDTRTLALDYIEHEIPSGATVLLQPYSVPLRPSREGLIEALRANLGSEARASVKFQRMLALDPYPTPAYRVLYLGVGGLDDEKIYLRPDSLGGASGLGPLRSLGVEYVVLKRYNDEAPLAPLLSALAREAERLQAFVPQRGEAAGLAVEPFLHNTVARIDSRLERPGPAIEIWRLPR